MTCMPWLNVNCVQKLFFAHGFCGTVSPSEFPVCTEYIWYALKSTQIERRKNSDKSPWIRQTSAHFALSIFMKSFLFYAFAVFLLLRINLLQFCIFCSLMTKLSIFFVKIIVKSNRFMWHNICASEQLLSKWEKKKIKLVAWKNGCAQKVWNRCCCRRHR